MITEQFDLKKGSRFLPQIMIVGLGIGTANYIMHGNFNWLQWTIQSLSTSFIIGYTLVAIGSNKSWFKRRFKPTWKMYLVIAVLFFLAAALATETEQIIRSLVFQDQQYQPLSAGKMYLFNGIISLVLGFSFFHYNFRTTKKPPLDEFLKSLSDDKSNVVINSSSSEPIINIPVKKGETVLFIPIENVVYFEAFDNYSFVYNLQGEKKLCDYSLLFLEGRLSEEFTRVHRKYIVNKNHIEQIKPHLNGRYVISFGNQISSVTSSKSYSSTIRNMIKIK
ncbi:MAG: LytTR family DNA-binding domain-containing protein [Flavobacteriaceae bacterium]|nr:LytTR family DNA-binding domain-containing protein [Flavobacteriaceae bacterium]